MNEIGRKYFAWRGRSQNENEIVEVGLGFVDRTFGRHGRSFYTRALAFESFPARVS